MTVKKLTPRQAEIAEKLAKSIAAYADMVKAAHAALAELEAAGADGFDIDTGYGYMMSQAREMLDAIEFEVAKEYETIPYKVTRDAAIDAFMAYVENLPKAQIAEAEAAARFAAGTK